MPISVGRRELITLLGGAAALPLLHPRAARAQQPALPLVGFINGGVADAATRYAVAFRKGLSETGYVEGQNVIVEYHWLEGRFDRVPALMADLIQRRVAVIATPGSTPPSLAAKAATTTIPVVFGVPEDPVKLGLVTNLARPTGNVTGVNFFLGEVNAKRLGLLHELVPKAARIAVLLNPSNPPNRDATVAEVQQAARELGVSIHILNASTNSEIDAAFVALVREQADALFLQADGFFASRRVQFATLAASNRVPTCYFSRDMIESGGLMSYGTNVSDMFRQVGIYTGSILKGTKPADLPVMQSTKFEFVINLQTAKSLGIEVSPMLLARADEVIE